MARAGVCVVLVTIMDKVWWRFQREEGMQIWRFELVTKISVLVVGMVVGEIVDGMRFARLGKGVEGKLTYMSRVLSCW